ncbi:MAG: hypothetical protein AB8H12_03645, partial [Lewinella sp.]
EPGRRRSDGSEAGRGKTRQEAQRLASPISPTRPTAHVPTPPALTRSRPTGSPLKPIRCPLYVEPSDGRLPLLPHPPLAPAAAPPTYSLFIPYI